MLTPDQEQWAIEHRELMQTIAKAETQVAALRRFAALPPETVAAVKYEASAMGRLAYEALEGNAARIGPTTLKPSIGQRLCRSASKPGIIAMRSSA